MADPQVFDRPELAALSDTRKGTALLSWVYWWRTFLAIFCPELPPGTRQARDLLLREPATLTADERDALHRFFRLHGTLSGGEKAIVLHLPLFAALAAHYEVAPHAPRLVLLDELTDEVDKAVTTTRFIWTGTALEQADLPEPVATPVAAGTLFES